MTEILMIHTRELCYSSGSFFMGRIADAMEELGVTVTHIEISDEEADYDILESLLLSCTRWSAVLDINSKLPYLELDDGSRFLDKLECPFYNFIVDHPLYHFTGLSFPLKNYHAIGIDMCHVRFMQQYFPALKSVMFSPIPGTKAFENKPFEDRKDALLFMGTYEDINKCYEDLKRQPLIEQNLVHFVIDGLLENRDTIENLVAEYLETESLTLADYRCDTLARLCNHTYLADKIVRSIKRKNVLEALGAAGISVDVFGEGWDLIDLDRYPSIKLMGPVDIGVSYQVMQDHKYVLDINPMFYNGVHDRVTSSLANGCICFSDMNPPAESQLVKNKHYISYDFTKPETLIHALRDNIGSQNNYKMLKYGKELYEMKYTWEKWAQNLLNALD